MTEQQRLRANITTRYGAAERATYEEVMRLVRETGTPQSRVQLLLVKIGLKHLNGPEGK